MDEQLMQLGIGNIHVNLTFKVSKPKKAVMHNVLYVSKLDVIYFL